MDSGQEKFAIHSKLILIFIIINVCNCLGSPVQTGKNITICQTAACAITASTIQQYMDKNVNPCDDFYEFACGNFLKNAPIRSEETSNQSFSMMEENVEKQLKSSIESINVNKDPEVFMKLKSFYDVCMNHGNKEINHDAKFRKILKELGGWPVMVGNSWNDVKFDWIKTAYELRKKGFSTDFFFTINVAVDMKNNTRRRIYVRNPGFGVKKEYLTRESESKVRSSYFKFMVHVATIFGRNRTQAVKDLDEVLKFKMQLAAICLTLVESRDPQNTYNPMTLTELQLKYPYIPWLTYINNIFSPHKVLESNDTIILTGPKYFEKLNDVLANTPKRVLANFIYWRVVLESISTLSKPVKDAYKKFAAELTGIEAKIPKWKLCLAYANRKMPLAVGSLYVRRHFDETKKQSMVHIVNDLHKTFEEILVKVDWMDEVTKKSALQKLHHMATLIAYPDELLNDDKLSNYYKDLSADPKSLLNTELSYNRYVIKLAVKLLKEPVVRFDWTGSFGAASMVNAFYSPTTNSIQFPSGILQHPFFNAENPRYANYAGIGMIVGHEMTHGFDDQGRQFSDDGHFSDWWDLETKKKFLDKAKCIVKQYSNYTSKDVGLKLNGELSLGENIADNGGVKIAYTAYDAWQRVNPEEPRLPGLEKYTPKQLFWISYAHGTCTKYRPEIEKLIILTDVHSIPRYRIIGSLSNRPEFSEDFQCPKGSPMNPEKKCSVW